ncbi:MAG: fumarylacetoacetate hydrolase family protein [Rikenellaceae bacterium]|nr:fumarylacetoacetate hydrolase family protein [Rikenellaceae bacterium]
MKIICIGKNYTDHIKELDGNSNIPEKPLFFTKPDTALLRNNEPFYIPDFTNEVHYETELVVRINRVTKCISEKFAGRCYTEVGLGIDFTARDVQRECIEKGLPWEICKAFDHSAAVSPVFIPLEELGGDIQNLNFKLELNGKIVQAVNTGEMIYGVNKLISYVSDIMTFKIGDLLFTGTPAGVGPVKTGDRLKASLADNVLLDFYIK